MKDENFVRTALVLLASAMACVVMVAQHNSTPIQIYYVQGTTGAAQAKASSSKSAASAQTVLVEKSVNINTATEDELCTLPGVGEKTAQRIIAYREANGGFYDIQELMEVSGIGEKTFARLEPYITIE